MKQSLHRLFKEVFVFSPAKRTGGGGSSSNPGGGERASSEARGAAAPHHSGGARLTAAPHHGAREEKGERPSERSDPPATLVRRDSMLRALRGQRTGKDTRPDHPQTPNGKHRALTGTAAAPLFPPQPAAQLPASGGGAAHARRRAGEGAAPAPAAEWEDVSRGRLKMAAPGATFRLLLPSFRPVAAAAVRSYGVRASGTGELVTHTGQVYEEKDYRRVRFVGRQKEVNKNFAIDLIAEQPVSEVESRVISCDGGGGALGHPKVYINLNTGTDMTELT
uniref:NADH:ubiquinone oxidoreductase subunit S6 n=1 Tax=Aquila chrysaetos chrysaetos TaxID=223781 RepID=A0A663DUA9_AQUCH